MTSADPLRYEVEGEVFATKSVKRRRKASTMAQRERGRLWQQARSRALTRLTKIYRPMYEVLMAEEKARLGMDPRIRARGPHPLMGIDHFAE